MGIYFMNNSITNIDKEMLWNLLYENNIFYDIPNEKKNEVENIFELSINNILNKNINNNLNTIELNKLILKEIKSKIDNLKNEMLFNQDIKNQFKEQKIKEFDRNLDYQINDMNNVLNPNKPDNIVFEENKDEPLENQELNELIETIQKKREEIF